MWRCCQKYSNPTSLEVFPFIFGSCSLSPKFLSIISTHSALQCVPSYLIIPDNNARSPSSGQAAPGGGESSWGCRGGGGHLRGRGRSVEDIGRWSPSMIPWDDTLMPLGWWDFDQYRMWKGRSITSDFDVQVNFLFALLKKGRMPRSYLRQGLHIVKIFRGQKTLTLSTRKAFI